MKLFQGLEEYDQIKRWVPLLDWILSNNRFSKEKGWNTKKKSSFTRRVKRLPGIGNDNWKVQAAKDGEWDFEKNDCVQIIMNSDSSEGESFVRHIRNGIAHGSTEIVKLKDILFLDICDFKDDSHQKQTAHIWLPIDLLFDIHHLYVEIEKQPEQRNQRRKKKEHLAG